MSLVKIQGNASGTGEFTIAAPNSNTNRTLTLPDATGTIITTAGGAAISGTTGAFTTTVGVGGATPAASGAGITFPATASASSDANTLDDYEEGTWSPVLSAGGNNATMNSSGNTGRYTKVGDIVHIRGYVAITSKGSMSGSVILNGLPFTVASGNSNYSGTSFGYGENLAVTAGQSICGYVTPTTTDMNIQLWDVSTGTSPLLASEITNTFNFILDVSYSVA
jgi:hypothetical protein